MASIRKRSKKYQVQTIATKFGAIKIQSFYIMDDGTTSSIPGLEDTISGNKAL